MTHPLAGEGGLRPSPKIRSVTSQVHKKVTTKKISKVTPSLQESLGRSGPGSTEADFVRFTALYEEHPHPSMCAPFLLPCCCLYFLHYR